jgi:hypothetical protein
MIMKLKNRRPRPKGAVEPVKKETLKELTWIRSNEVSAEK